ncbi:MAG: hypothetical protein JWQ54_2344 [Mucilaginibacter sp.]|nr:hypothetical protein [Mucilaginibacter sp.]
MFESIKISFIIIRFVTIKLVVIVRYYWIPGISFFNILNILSRLYFQNILFTIYFKGNNFHRLANHFIWQIKNIFIINGCNQLSYHSISHKQK